MLWITASFELRDTRAVAASARVARELGFDGKWAIHPAQIVPIDAEFAASQLRSGAFPRLAEMFGDGRICAQGDRFDQGLRRLLGRKPDSDK